MAENDIENKTKDLTYTLNKIQNNVFHIKTKNQLSDSIINFFTMAIGFFMFGCINADIIFSNETKYLIYGAIIISGVTQIILGIYEWYKGKSLYILVNFSFGLLFISWFLKYNLMDNNEVEKNKKYEGAFYIIWLLLSISITIAGKNKGIIYLLDYAIVAVAFVFLFIDRYINKNWIKKTYGYIFIVSGGLFWITGLLRLINSSFLNNSMGIVRE